MERPSVISKNDTLFHKMLIFMLCLGRMDGVLYETDVVFMGLIVLSFFGLFLNILGDGGILKSTYFKWQYSILAFFALSLSWAYDVEQGVVILIAYLGRAIIMLYIYSYLVRTADIVYLCKSYILATILVILHLFVVYGTSGMIKIRAEELDVSQGWNANAMGVMCVIAIFMLVYVLYDFKKVISNKKKLSVFLFLVLFIFMTGSKTSFFVLFGTYALSYYFNSNSKITSLIVIILGLSVLFLLIMNNPFLYSIMGERIKSLIYGFSSIDSDERTVSDNIRFLMLNFGWEKFLEQPVWGYGVGNFQALFGEINNGKRMYAHNNMIEMLVNVGIIGFVIYYWLYSHIIKLSLKCKERNFGVICASFIIILILSESGQVTYLVFSNQILLCLLLYILLLKKTN